MLTLTQIRPMTALVGAGLALLLTTACTVQDAQNALPSKPDERTQALAEIKDNLDTLAAGKPAPALPPASTAELMVPDMLTGMGFSQINGQPGKTINEKRLLALKAARMDAMRDLTEQIHGIQISATTNVRQMVTRDDNLNAVVSGTLRGARTLKITPKGSDGYEVQLAVDKDTVAYIVRAFQGAL